MMEEDNRYVNNQNYYNVQNNPFDYLNNYQYKEVKPKKNKIIIPIILSILVISIFFFLSFLFSNSGDKKRTIMIYMVGSDLESKSKQGTFSLADITRSNIDLRHNNIILMVGGSEKWHNFVNKDEIGIYELTSSGFVKKKQMPVESMGSDSTLEKFLDYSYEEYPAEKYDMIFWNHGLGAIGIEQDELSKDFLTINELNNAFRNSPFSKEKLELTIFYNCLASNLHIANIMKNYSNYMVASEEIFYLSKSLNRLDFLENIKTSDTAYDIGYHFIKKSDQVVNEYNNNHIVKIDSTLSIIDLNEVDELNTKLNNFIKTINLDDNYYDISYYRRNTHTYGISQTYDYDTVDLYDLVSSLGKITNSNLTNDVLSQISETIKYTSNFNDYSNGISVYFPYFGKDSSIETHLLMFSKIFNDDYYKFINNFYEVRSGNKQIRKGNKDYNKLTNEIKTEDGYITLLLSDKEKESFEQANIYLFKKNGNKYELLLEQDNIEHIGNKVLFSPIYNKVLRVNNNNFSYSNDTAYGRVADDNDLLDVKFNIFVNSHGFDDIKGIKINEVILDSKEYISSSIVELDDYNKVAFAKELYNLYKDGIFNEDFKETRELEYITFDKEGLDISLVNNSSNGYYALIEVKDINGDLYYSNLKLIK